MSLSRKVYATPPPYADERRFADAQSLSARVSEVWFQDSTANLSVSQPNHERLRLVVEAALPNVEAVALAIGTAAMLRRRVTRPTSTRL
jgi:hypothetical protein